MNASESKTGRSGKPHKSASKALGPEVLAGRAEPLTLIVGLGKTGLSVARYLRSQGVSVAVTDSRAVPPGLDQARSEMPDLALALGGFDPELFAVADRLILSPGVSLRSPAVAEAASRGVPVLGDIELFAAAAKAPVVAITGSNGKSTVTSLLGFMARLAGVQVAVGGNLGDPALELLDERIELYVLEVSSFQLESTQSLAPRAATVLNVSADHMDRYDSLQAYAETKARIFHRTGTAVINRDDPLVRVMGGQASVEIGFTLRQPMHEDDFGLMDHCGETWLARGREPIIAAAEIALAGRHNLANALAALALGSACGLPVTSMQEALRRFRGLPHRTVLVAEKSGVRWYDDSKGTNPGATVAALNGLVDPDLPARAVLIAGGDCKGADFSPLVAAVKRTTRAVVLIGRDAPLIERVLRGEVSLLRADDMESAVRLAAMSALPGDCVLLSPACASFDMFDNFEHRGRAFAAAVEGLAA